MGDTKTFDIREAVDRVKAITIELAYNDVYDDDGELNIENAAREMNLYRDLCNQLDAIRNEYEKLEDELKKE